METRDMIEELMDTAYFRMFTAGRADLRMDQIEGFLSVEVFSWWILLVGVYLGYLSVKNVTDDYEESRMDMIFSTPLSRKQYLLEKFVALSLFTLILLVLSGLMLTISVYSVGASYGLEFNPFMVAIVSSWPMFLVIIAVSMLLAVFFKDSKMAVGGVFTVILVQYAVFMAGHMVESLEFILPYTISYYWDYNSVLLDGVFRAGYFVFLTILALVIFAVSMHIFDRGDIPA